MPADTNKRLCDSVAEENDSQKCARTQVKIEEQCVLCFRNAEELEAADSPLMQTHSCPQCNKTSWSICEECEETCLSRKCPVCRSPYAPIILYEFPSLQPNQMNPNRAMEVSLARAKISLITKIVGGSNSALYLPGDGKLRFFLPESFAINTQFSCINIPVTHDRVSNGKFIFNDSVWDELDDFLADEETPEEGGELEVPTYLPVCVEECPKEVADRINTTFVDSEDRKTYKIHSVCKLERSGHTDSGKLMYKYYNIDTYVENPPQSPEEYEYTPCDEVLTADWVTWTCDKEEWVMCCSCSKWRRLPKRDAADYPQNVDPNWTCGMNSWDTRYKTCDSPEEDYSQTVSVAEEIDGVAVPICQEDVRPVDNNGSGDTDAVILAEGTTLNRGSASSINMDLAEVLKTILEALKSYPGARLFTRLSPDTTDDILRIAREEGGKTRRC